MKMSNGEFGSVHSGSNRTATAMRSTRSHSASNGRKLSDNNASVYRSNGADQFESLRNTRSRSSSTAAGHQSNSAAAVIDDPVTNPKEGVRLTPMYAEHYLPSDETVKLPQFYGTTTTGVCIDDKVLKQISQNQAKFMQDRITIVQKHFGNLCETFGGYARALCKVRDNGDRVAMGVLALAMDETLNETAKNSLGDFAEHFSAVQDYEESQVRRIEERVIKPLMNYGTSCKQAKERLKKACAIRKKELDQKKVLDKTKEQKPYDTQHVLQVQTNLQTASVNALRADNEVEHEIEKFEKRKLEDLKQILTDFVGIEIFYHIRALEQLSSCSRAFANMNVNSDLEQFLTSLRPISTQSRMSAQRKLEEQGSEKQTFQSLKQQNRPLTYPQKEYSFRDDEQVVEDEEYVDETDDEDDESEEESVRSIPTKSTTRPVISA